MSNAIQIYNSFDQLKLAADALFQSGFFTDTRTQAQAIVKVMAGAELGLPPFAAMAGINIIQGKPVLGANVIATLVKNDPRYDYIVTTCTDAECQIDWYEGGKKRGTTGFTIREAQNAKLAGKDNWTKYPSDMLFARAISRGARRFAPGIFGGAPVYTPDEMGIETDPDGYVDAQTKPVPSALPEPEPSPEAQADARSIDEQENSAPDFSQVTNSKGIKYVDLPTETLSHMANQMITTLAKGDQTPEHQSELEVKLEAARQIIAARNGK